jgi:hypothetical protein
LSLADAPYKDSTPLTRAALSPPYDEHRELPHRGDHQEDRDPPRNSAEGHDACNEQEGDRAQQGRLWRIAVAFEGVVSHCQSSH